MRFLFGLLFVVPAELGSCQENQLDLIRCIFSLGKKNKKRRLVIICVNTARGRGPRSPDSRPFLRHVSGGGGGGGRRPGENRTQCLTPALLSISHLRLSRRHVGFGEEVLSATFPRANLEGRAPAAKGGGGGKVRAMFFFVVVTLEINKAVL